MEIKKMDIQEFYEKGFLQEANRLFFHRLGLALEIKIDDNGNYSLGGIWDYRKDPEGMIFGKPLKISNRKEKMKNVEELRQSKVEARLKIKEVNIDENGIQIFE